MKLLIILSLFSSLALAQNVDPDRVLGIWWSPKKDAHIEITKTDDRYNGRIIWSLPENAENLDTKNPDPKLRNEKIMGSVILKDFKFDGEKWTQGTIYDPNNGKTYSCKITLEGNSLNVRGYIGFSLLGRTEVFQRYLAD
jgi:uncharacterized protein (DUF2147 family)